MGTSTFETQKSIAYGFILSPTSYCKVINIKSKEELLLAPGIQYYLPWNREDTQVIEVKVITTEEVSEMPRMLAVDSESFNWLKVAERSFKFWDNEVDEVWNNV
jgi:hypothetical protein